MSSLDQKTCENCGSICDANGTFCGNCGKLFGTKGFEENHIPSNSDSAT